MGWEAREGARERQPLRKWIGFRGGRKIFLGGESTGVKM